MPQRHCFALVLGVCRGEGAVEIRIGCILSDDLVDEARPMSSTGRIIVEQTSYEIHGDQPGGADVELCEAGRRKALQGRFLAGKNRSGYPLSFIFRDGAIRYRVTDAFLNFEQDALGSRFYPRLSESVKSGKLPTVLNIEGEHHARPEVGNRKAFRVDFVYSQPGPLLGPHFSQLRLHGIELTPEHGCCDASQYSSTRCADRRYARPVPNTMSEWIWASLLVSGILCGVTTCYVDNRWPKLWFVPLAVFVLLAILAAAQLNRLTIETAKLASADRSPEDIAVSRLLYRNWNSATSSGRCFRMTLR